MATQQRDEDAAGEAFDATLSESEEEDTDSDSGELPVAVKPAAWQEGPGARASISAEEMRQNQEDFRSLMEVNNFDSSCRAIHDFSSSQCPALSP